MSKMLLVEPLRAGATIGIVGGGQLGRMLALAGASLGLRIDIYCPDKDSPAFDVAANHMVADYDDEAALSAFAARVDRVTYEFENIPAKAMAALCAGVLVLPPAQSLQVSQDRLIEKTFLRDLGVPVGFFAAVDNVSDLRKILAEVKQPCVMKTRRFGYDGKGQVRIERAEDAEKAYTAIGEAPAIVESFIDFNCEISVVVARSSDGRMVSYEPAENRHENHILRKSFVPANVAPKVCAKACRYALDIAESLDHVGVLAVEYFVQGAGEGAELLVNEIAPRVHNSGHWTQDGALTCQFEQHIRAVAGWPLGSCKRIADVCMTNLLGEEACDPASLAVETGACLHIYGKKVVKPFRKMGHINRMKIS